MALVQVPGGPEAPIGAAGRLALELQRDEPSCVVLMPEVAIEGLVQATMDVVMLLHRDAHREARDAVRLSGISPQRVTDIRWMNGNEKTRLLGCQWVCPWPRTELSMQLDSMIIALREDSNAWSPDGRLRDALQCLVGVWGCGAKDIDGLAPRYLEAPLGPELAWMAAIDGDVSVLSELIKAMGLAGLGVHRKGVLEVMKSKCFDTANTYGYRVSAASGVMLGHEFVVGGDLAGWQGMQGCITKLKEAIRSLALQRKCSVPPIEGEYADPLKWEIIQIMTWIDDIDTGVGAIVRLLELQQNDVEAPQDFRAALSLISASDGLSFRRNRAAILPTEQVLVDLVGQKALMIRWKSPVQPDK